MLNVATSYTWRVDAIGPGGLKRGDTWAFTTASQPSPPPPPSKATNPSPANGDITVDPASVNLVWADGGGATSYNVYLNGVFQVNQSGTVFAAGALSDLTVYTWRIDSINASGLTMGDTWVFTTTSGLPGKASAPIPANGDLTVDSSSVTLSWTAGLGATSYDVYLDGVFQVTQAGTSYNAGALLASTAYTWRIDSVNGTGTTTGDTWNFTTAAPAENPLVTNWAGRVVTNGGAAPSASTRTALSNFCDSLDGAGLTALMKVVNCVVPDNLIAATTPLIVGSGNNPWTNHNFIAGDLTVNGLRGDASTKWLDTGFACSSWSAFSYGVTVYIASNGNNNNEAEVGAFTSGVTGFNIGTFGGNFSFYLTLSVSATLQVADGGNYVGYFSANRVANNDLRYFRATSSLSHAQVGFLASVIADERASIISTVGVFGVNQAGSPLFPSGKRDSFFAIHSGLSLAQSSTFYTLIQALRTALGGGFV